MCIDNIICIRHVHTIQLTIIVDTSPIIVKSEFNIIIITIVANHCNEDVNCDSLIDSHFDISWLCNVISTSLFWIIYDNNCGDIIVSYVDIDVHVTHKLWNSVVRALHFVYI